MVSARRKHGSAVNIVTLVHENATQTAEAFGQVAMVGPEHLLLDGDGAAEEGLGRHVVAAVV